MAYGLSTTIFDGGIIYCVDVCDAVPAVFIDGSVLAAAAEPNEVNVCVLEFEFVLDVVVTVAVAAVLAARTFVVVCGSRQQAVPAMAWIDGHKFALMIPSARASNKP